jgi:hypothetical protein
VNDEKIDENILNLYEEDGATQVVIDVGDGQDFNIIKAPLVKISIENKYIRHNPRKLGEVIINI